MLVLLACRELNYAITSSPLEKRYEVTVLLAEVDGVVGRKPLRKVHDLLAASHQAYRIPFD